MSLWWGLNFQNMISLVSFYLDVFHDFILGVLLFILVTVFGVVWFIISSKIIIKAFYESFILEVVWTLYPIIILILIGIPSMRILYLHEVEESGVGITLKITGHQWYWSSDYSDFSSVEFDSFMKPVEDLELGEFRLLDVDNRNVVPILTNMRLILSSADVLHSWAIPSMGVKVDANPGRLNVVYSLPSQMGLFFGQCSEICGANHSFMPINLEVVSFFNFKQWINQF